MRWSRFTELLIGHTANQVLLVWPFDYVLYPLAIYWLGLVWGFSAMAALSLLICWLMMKAYDRSKHDWLGIEAVKALRTYEGDSAWRRWTARMLQQSDPVVCLFLSVKFDPFITTAYLRRGAYNGMSCRDWKVFLASWLIGNLFWTLTCFGGVSAFRWVKRGM